MFSLKTIHTMSLNGDTLIVLISLSDVQLISLLYNRIKLEAQQLQMR